MTFLLKGTFLIHPDYSRFLDSYIHPAIPTHQYLHLPCLIRLILGPPGPLPAKFAAVAQAAPPLPRFRQPVAHPILSLITMRPATAHARARSFKINCSSAAPASTFIISRFHLRRAREIPATSHTPYLLKEAPCRHRHGPRQDRAYAARSRRTRPAPVALECPLPRLLYPHHQRGGPAAEPFTVDSLSKASWCASRILEAQARVDQRAELARSYKARIDAWLADANSHRQRLHRLPLHAPQALGRD